MKLLEKIILFFLLLRTSSVSGQVNCQDPQAVNFNPASTFTDTSCQYPVTEISTSPVCFLPTGLSEASSMLQTDGRWFIINDSGNQPEIYEVKPSGSANCQIVKKSRVINFPNIDWEDLAADSTHIYIGDFGNNAGNRTNLRILKVSKSVLYHPDSINIRAEKLDFSYPDQLSFLPSNNHNFDCEAFFYLNGKLHLFSKNRGNLKTKHYSLYPNLPGQTATLHDSLNAGGLITSASVRKDGKVVVLLGHENGGSLAVFSWLLYGFQDADLFKGNRRKILHNNLLFNGQTEGIGFMNEDTLLISNELFSIVPAAIRKVEIGSLTDPFFVTRVDSKGSGGNEERYPAFLFSDGFISLNRDVEEVYLHDINGVLMYKGSWKELNLLNLAAGMYFLLGKDKNGNFKTYGKILNIK